MILKLEECGYSKQDARARVCQDIVIGKFKRANVRREDKIFVEIWYI